MGSKGLRVPVSAGSSSPYPGAQDVWAPARCLLSLCRPSVSEDDLKSLFSSNGGVVKGFKFFQ